MKVAVALTGASGMVYGLKLLEELKKNGCETYVVMSENARKIMAHETGTHEHDVKGYATAMYDEHDMESPLASGSFTYDALVIVPCSLKTLACVANGLAMNLVARAALCCFKEGRKLILVPRETPLDVISLENMVKAARAGAVILPAMPAFYHKPETIDDMVGYVVGKILEQLGIPHSLYEKWG